MPRTTHLLGLAVCLGATALSTPAAAVTPDASDSLLNQGEKPVRVRLNAEVGALLPAKHNIQLSKAGTRIDYVADGGQDNLFPFLRFSTDLDVGDKHTVVFLYQPLNLETKATTERPLRVDGQVFTRGTGVRYRYGFDFYRLSWLRDVAKGDKKEVAFGAGVQLRNAILDFESLDGTQFVSDRNIGPVPLLKARVRLPVGDGWWWGAEADGFYAPIAYINGSNTDVVGSILDLSTRMGLALRPGVDGYLNLRYLTGGAEGTSNDMRVGGDGYTWNYLHFVSLSLGFSLR